MEKILLELNNIEGSIDNIKIIKDLNLIVRENEIHVIMGPNGSGKSTLSKLLAGHPAYELNKGSITFCGKNLNEMKPEIRSHEGLFLAFQYPVEIGGVSNYDFLRIAYNEKQKYQKKAELDPLEFMQLIDVLIKKLKIKSEFLNRNLNEGFSGGEKKRNEILQMLLLDPKLVILDEIDSGLDVDAIKIICDNIVSNLDKNASLILITHYPKILTYLKPTHVHIMINGKIVKTGNLELVEKLDKNGYEQFFSNPNIL
jgi:Fe-S cluster assembly ATP-binding protein